MVPMNSTVTVIFHSYLSTVFYSRILCFFSYNGNKILNKQRKTFGDSAILRCTIDEEKTNNYYIVRML